MALLKNVVIKADEQTNALIITAAPDVMRDLEAVVAKLDVRRAQVLVEAVIVEVQDGQGLNIGVQWANKYGGGTQFAGSAPGVSAGFENGMSDVFGKANGLMTGFYSGNWGVLLSAIASNNQNNILATPSIVTLDNAEAEFSVGQDVPILTGSQTTNSDNVFNTVSRKTVGIKLKVKPQINQGQSVLMQIEQEVSSVADSAGATPDSLGRPSISARSTTRCWWTAAKPWWWAACWTSPIRSWRAACRSSARSRWWGRCFARPPPKRASAI